MTTDPLDGPLFTDNATAPTNGRVRSTFRFDPNPEPVAAVTPLHPRTSNRRPRQPADLPDLDWGLVGRMRAEVARRLSERLGEARWERDAEEAEGAAIIQQVLEEDTAEAIARVGHARSLGERRRSQRRCSTRCSGWAGCSRCWTTRRWRT